MVTTRVCLLHVEEYYLLNLELADAQTGQISERFFKGEKLISEYSERKF